MSFRIPDFPVLKSPLNLSQTLSEAIADRYTRANAVKQEKLNPYVSDTAKADLAHKILENQYYGRDKESEINQRTANSRHLNVESDFIPVESYIKANNSLRANSRFGTTHELVKLLNTMDPAERAAWRSQHPAEWAELLNDSANGISSNGKTNNNDNEAEQILKNELRRIQAGNINRPAMTNNIMPSTQSMNSNAHMNTDNMSRHDLVSRANADQATYDQKNNIPNNQSIISNQNANPRIPLNQAVVGTLPIENQPTSNDPLVADVQQKLNNRIFETTPNQAEQLKNAAIQTSLLKSTSAFNKGRLEGAKVAEIWLQENRTPKIMDRIRNTAEFAGQWGQKRAAVEAHLPESLQSQAFKDSKWFHKEFVPNMSNVIKQMEKLTGDQKQRQELHDMMDILTDPDLGPKGALQAFNRAVESLQTMSDSIFSAVENKDTKGFFKKMYGLPPKKYDEYIPSEDKQPASGKSISDIDAKIAELDRKIKEGGG